MGVKIGEVDLTQILENEYRIGVLEGMVDWILTNNSAFVKNLTQDAMAEIREDVLARLREKYPNSGIRFKSE